MSRHGMPLKEERAFRKRQLDGLKRTALECARLPDNPRTDPIVDGAAFILDRPDDIAAVWGQSPCVLWAKGEALMIAGGQGLGKTTLAGQVCRARMLGGEVLGLPVERSDTPILYLGMDRPSQIARSMGRQFTEADRKPLSEKLIVRTGPPAADLATNPTLLAEIAQRYGAGTVFVDSLKDAAVGLSSDEVGAGYNRARQHLLAQGVELCELHHDRKAGAGGGASSTVSDIYGSTWLTAGCGSVILLTGDPGDPIIGFRHVKQPVEEIGPFRLLHDQAAGQLTVDFDIDLIELAKAAGPDGLTAHAAAAAIFEKKNPTRADAEKARRRLEQKVEAGLLRRVEGGKGRGNAAAWFAS